jgi:hypothetical protein
MRKFIFVVSLCVATTIAHSSYAGVWCHYNQKGPDCAISVTDCMLKGGTTVAGEPACTVKRGSDRAKLLPINLLTQDGRYAVPNMSLSSGMLPQSGSLISH